ncbi:MAG TPA: glycosyltransferase, partial [Cytophagaceae bacterium]
MKKLSIIIVNYNVCHFLEQAIRSVLNATKSIDAEIFIIDNNSVDGSVEMVQAKFPELN